MPDNETDRAASEDPKEIIRKEISLSASGRHHLCPSCADELYIATQAAAEIARHSSREFIARTMVLATCAIPITILVLSYTDSHRSGPWTPDEKILTCSIAAFGAVIAYLIKATKKSD